MGEVLSQLGFCLGVVAGAIIFMVLFRLGVDGVRDWIEARWPDSDRAKAIGYWFRVLAPLPLLVLMGLAVWLLR
jgi:hypothetical protein